MSKPASLPKERILFEDKEFLIVDKPAGILSTHAPGRGTSQVLVPMLSALLKEMGEDSELYAVHRLDEDTTGALVLARSEQMRAQLDRLFRRHEIERIYHAIVSGRPSPASGTLTSRLVVDEQDVVRVVRQGGERAITHYATLHSDDAFSLLACRLETGKRNQIRVQLADRGHPLLGDRKYGNKKLRETAPAAPRCMLHASALGLTHPSTGETLRVVAPFPRDFQDLLGKELSEKFALGAE